MLFRSCSFRTTVTQHRPNRRGLDRGSGEQGVVKHHQETLGSDRKTQDSNSSKLSIKNCHENQELRICARTFDEAARVVGLLARSPGDFAIDRVGRQRDRLRQRRLSAKPTRVSKRHIEQQSEWGSEKFKELSSPDSRNVGEPLERDQHALHVIVHL